MANKDLSWMVDVPVLTFKRIRSNFIEFRNTSEVLERKPKDQELPGRSDPRSGSRAIKNSLSYPKLVIKLNQITLGPLNKKNSDVYCPKKALICHELIINPTKHNCFSAFLDHPGYTKNNFYL